MDQHWIGKDVSCTRVKRDKVKWQECRPSVTFTLFYRFFLPSVLSIAYRIHSLESLGMRNAAITHSFLLFCVFAYYSYQIWIKLNFIDFLINCHISIYRWIYYDCFSYLVHIFAMSIFQVNLCVCVVMLVLWMRFNALIMTTIMVMTMVGIEFKQYNINIGTHALKYTKKEKSSSSSFNTSSRLASMQPFVWYK